MTEFTWPFLSATSFPSVLIWLVVHVAVEGTVHAAGTFGEAVMVSGASGLKPVALMRATTLLVVCGT